MSKLTRLTPLLLLTLALSGCGPDKNEFAPPCPSATLVKGLDELTRYAPGGGRDLTDTIVQGRVVALNGSCRLTDKKGTTVEAVATVGAELLRGPAMRGRHQDVTIFIAVTEGKEVLDKRVFQVPVDFPTNIESVRLTSPEMRLILPTSPSKSPAAFNIIAGFQLTPEELAANLR